MINAVKGFVKIQHLKLLQATGKEKKSKEGFEVTPYISRTESCALTNCANPSSFKLVCFVLPIKMKVSEPFGPLSFYKLRVQMDVGKTQFEIVVL